MEYSIGDPMWQRSCFDELVDQILTYTCVVVLLEPTTKFTLCYGFAVLVFSCYLILLLVFPCDKISYCEFDFFRQASGDRMSQVHLLAIFAFGWLQ